MGNKVVGGSMASKPTQIFDENLAQERQPELQVMDDDFYDDQDFDNKIFENPDENVFENPRRKQVQKNNQQENEDFKNQSSDNDEEEDNYQSQGMSKSKNKVPVMQHRSSVNKIKNNSNLQLNIEKQQQQQQNFDLNDESNKLETNQNNKQQQQQLDLPLTPNKLNNLTNYQHSLITFLDDDENTKMSQKKSQNPKTLQLDNLDINTPHSQRISTRRKSNKYSYTSSNLYQDDISEFTNDFMSKQGEQNKNGMDNYQYVDNMEYNSLYDFINEPLQKKKCLLCQVLKKGKILSTYEFYMGNQVLITAEQKFNHKQSEYILYIVDQKSQQKKSVGRIKGNFFGSEYVIFNEGDNPQIQMKNMNTVNDMQLKNNLKQLCRKNIGAVTYNTVDNIRQIEIIIPVIDRLTQKAVDYIPLDDKNLLINKFTEYQKEVNKIRKISKKMEQREDVSVEDVIQNVKNEKLKDFLVYENKIPVYNEQTQQLELDFSERVKETSTKNFQLVENQNKLCYILQQGKDSKNKFNVDVCWPLSPLQAFAICITSFDKKWE